MSKGKDTWEVKQKLGLFKVQEHDKLKVEPSLFDHKNRTYPYNLSALELVEEAYTQHELSSWLEENKEDFHAQKFVVMPIFDVEYKINFDE